MRARLLPLLLFLIFSIFLFIFSKQFSYPFDFFASLFSSPRAFLYVSVHAEGKPSEIDSLKAENKKLREELVQLDALKKDNEALRSQFMDTVISSQKLLPAKVIGFRGSLDNPTTFILDQGEKSGIKKGMAVITERLLVGKVGDITPWNSEAILVTNKNFTTLGITSKDNSSGIITGQEDFIIFEKVVITDSLSKGDTVLTRGELDPKGSGIPADLIIGKVDSVSKSETKPFQSAVVKSLINFNKLKTVFVVVQ